MLVKTLRQLCLALLSTFATSAVHAESTIDWNCEINPADPSFNQPGTLNTLYIGNLSPFAGEYYSNRVAVFMDTRWDNLGTNHRGLNVYGTASFTETADGSFVYFVDPTADQELQFKTLPVDIADDSESYIHLIASAQLHGSNPIESFDLEMKARARHEDFTRTFTCTRKAGFFGDALEFNAELARKLNVDITKGINDYRRYQGAAFITDEQAQSLIEQTRKRLAAKDTRFADENWADTLAQHPAEEGYGFVSNPVFDPHTGILLQSVVWRDIDDSSYSVYYSAEGGNEFVYAYYEN